MSDDDMIRRGDALRVADEVFDQCENVNGDDRGAFAAAEVGARIAALPAVTIQQITAGPEQCERDLEDTAAQAREAALTVPDEIELYRIIKRSGAKKRIDIARAVSVHLELMRRAFAALIGEART